MAALGVAGYFLLQAPAATTPPPPPDTSGVGGSVQRGNDTTAGVLGLISQGLNTFTSIYTTENANAQRSINPGKSVRRARKGGITTVLEDSSANKFGSKRPSPDS